MVGCLVCSKLFVTIDIVSCLYIEHGIAVRSCQQITTSCSNALDTPTPSNIVFFLIIIYHICDILAKQITVNMENDMYCHW